MSHRRKSNGTPKWAPHLALRHQIRIQIPQRLARPHLFANHHLRRVARFVAALAAARFLREAARRGRHRDQAEAVGTPDLAAERLQCARPNQSSSSGHRVTSSTAERSLQTSSPYRD